MKRLELPGLPSVFLPIETKLKETFMDKELENKCEYTLDLTSQLHVYAKNEDFADWFNNIDPFSRIVFVPEFGYPRIFGTFSQKCVWLMKTTAPEDREYGWYRSDENHGMEI